LTENLPRVLPDHTQANISLSSWQRPAIFEWLQTEGNIADDEMLRTFNCGIGMVLVVEASQAEAILKTCQDSGIQGWRLGEIVTSTSTQVEPFVHYVA
jgi:phosphoribosylformylglycinamidine cyclo-ligase